MDVETSNLMIGQTDAHKTKQKEENTDRNEQLNSSGPTRDHSNIPDAPANSFDLQYRIDENPSWLLCIFLGLQHYLTMFGATVAVPFILAPHLCIDNNPLALSEIISTIFFVSGISTLLQTTIGNRLPIVQGATFSFLGPAIAILSLPQYSCKNLASPSGTQTNGTNGSSLNRQHNWKTGMLEIQGSIMVSSILQVVVGLTGLVGIIIRFVGPLTIGPTIAIIGLSLFDAAAGFSSKHWGIACMTVFFIILFSQILSEVKIPVPWFSTERKCTIVRSQLFKIFPILLAILVSWIICAIITAAGGFSSNPKHPGFYARTDARSSVLKSANWFRVPYPGQWGTPTVTLTGVVGMFAAIIASIIESVGDYYACARFSGAPPPPRHAINRGIAIEGIGCILAGAWGSGNGTTSYSENIGAIGMTKVGSRRVIQCGALFMLTLSCLGKFGALFTTIPDPVIGGMFWALFGMILAVGLSNLQFVDLNSSRNLFVLGFSFFTGMVVPEWLKDPKNSTAISTGSTEADQIIQVILKTNMGVTGCIAMVLDNLLPGTEEERGLKKWREIVSVDDTNVPGNASVHVYDPLCTSLWVGKKWLKYVPFLPYYPEAPENSVVQNPGGGVELTGVKKVDHSQASCVDQRHEGDSEIISNKYADQHQEKSVNERKEDVIKTFV